MKIKSLNIKLLFTLFVFSLSFFLSSFYTNLQADEDNFEVLTHADSVFFEGKLDEALNLYKSILKNDSENIYVLNKIALINIKQNHPSAAKKYYAKIVSLQSKNTFAHYWLGILALKDNNIDTAFEQFSKIVSIDPNDSNAAYAHMFLGTIYIFRHQPYLAILELKKARMKADKADVHYKLARAYHDAGMTKNAKLEYIMTLRLEPSNLRAIDGLGWIYYTEGNRSKAIEIWKKGLVISKWKYRELNENLAKAFNDIALEKYNEKNIADAKKYWKKVLTFDSKNKLAIHFLRKIKK